MEIQLLPAVSLLPETLSVLIAPEKMLARALNGNPHLQQFRIIFINDIRPSLRKGQGYGGPCCPGHEAGLSGCIRMYAPVLDRHIEAMAEFAGSVVCFYDLQSAGDAWD